MVADPLRVSVLVGGRRTDLAVPVGLPVAELLPLLVEPDAPGADAVRTLDLALTGGPPLDPEVPLEEQGVRPGAVLVVTATGGPLPVLDDPAEALAAEVSRASTWTTSQRGDLRLVAAAVLGLLAACGLVVLLDPAAGGGTGAAGAAALLALAAWASRARRPGAVPAALLACLLAAAATTALVGAPVTATPARAWLVVAGPAVGATVLGASMLGAAALVRRRALLLVAVVPGVTLTVLALLARAPWAPTALLAGVVTVLVVLGGYAPGAALALVGRGADPLRDPYPDDGADRALDPRDDPRADRDDRDDLATDAARAADLLAGTAGGVGVVLVVAAPLLATTGRAAAALAAALALHLVLRARRSRAALLVAAELGPGALALVGVAGAVLVHDPAVGRVLVPVLVLGLLVLLLPGPASPVGRRRAGDLAETATAVALLPLLAVVTGLLDAVGG